MKRYFAAGGMSRSVLMAILLILVLLVAGFSLSCQYGAPAKAPSAPPAAPSGVAIAIQGFAFQPATLTVTAGTTVTWSNNDSASHTVTAQGNLFASDTLSSGATFSYTFRQSGSFAYYCKFHPSMTGKVTVP